MLIALPLNFRLAAAALKVSVPWLTLKAPVAVSI